MTKFNKNLPPPPRVFTPAPKMSRSLSDLKGMVYFIVPLLFTLIYIEIPAMSRHVISLQGTKTKAEVLSFETQKNIKGVTRRFYVIGTITLPGGATQQTRIDADRNRFLDVQRKFYDQGWLEESSAKKLSTIAGSALSISIKTENSTLIIPIKYMTDDPGVSTLIYSSYWEHSDIGIWFIMVGILIGFYCLVIWYRRWVQIPRRERYLQLGHLVDVQVKPAILANRWIHWKWEGREFSKRVITQKTHYLETGPSRGEFVAGLVLPDKPSKIMLLPIDCFGYSLEK